MSTTYLSILQCTNYCCDIIIILVIVAVLQLFYRGGLWWLEMTLLVKVSFILSIVANFQNGDQQKTSNIQISASEAFD